MRLLMCTSKVIDNSSGLKEGNHARDNGWISDLNNIIWTCTVHVSRFWRSYFFVSFLVLVLIEKIPMYMHQTIQTEFSRPHFQTLKRELKYTYDPPRNIFDELLGVWLCCLECLECLKHLVNRNQNYGENRDIKL